MIPRGVLALNTKKFGMSSVALISVAALPSLLLSTIALAQGGRYQSDDAWSFGATADTQWTITHSLEWAPDDLYYAHVNPNYREENPDYVSVSTLLKLND